MLGTGTASCYERRDVRDTMHMEIAGTPDIESGRKDIVIECSERHVTQPVLHSPVSRGVVLELTPSAQDILRSA